MTPLQNDVFLRALLREPTPYTPIWLMRQAGRYLPEYRATRARAGSFMGLATTPELACEVTLQPLDRYPLDAAIIFSDILTVPDAMGLELTFVEGEGPKFLKPVRSEDDVKRIGPVDVDAKLRYVSDAIAVTRKALAGRVPLIGFCGSPFTLACYMIEGGGSDDFRLTKTMLYQRPDVMHQLLTKNADALVDYLNAQIAAGAQAVMMFDTWGGMLTGSAYAEFSLAYAARVFARVTREAEGRVVPRIFFTKGGGAWLEGMSAIGVDALGLDWQTDIHDAWQRVGGGVGNPVALQGNLDPSILFAPPTTICREAKRILDAYGDAPGHVFNLGHGISQFTPPEHVEVLTHFVRRTSAEIRKKSASSS
jgi:uroporphyrinogen decarboxylase